MTRWGFPRSGAHRLTFRDQALQGLDAEVARRGARLDILVGHAAEVIAGLAHHVAASRVFCEAIAAPEEAAELAALRSAGLEVVDRWQSTLLDVESLPFAVETMPPIFTAFRHAVEAAGASVGSPLAAPAQFPPGIDLPPGFAFTAGERSNADATTLPSGPASFPYQDPLFHGAESAALEYLERYFSGRAPQTYKETRNGLSGTEYSTKLSPWLAVGAVSTRSVMQHLRAHEARFGANDSTYWIWFELLWRDYFKYYAFLNKEKLFLRFKLMMHARFYY